MKHKFYPNWIQTLAHASQCGLVLVCAFMLVFGGFRGTVFSVFLHLITSFTYYFISSLSVSSALTELSPLYVCLLKNGTVMRYVKQHIANTLV